MSLQPNCTSQEIHDFLLYNYTSACSFVQTVCANETTTVDFFSFYYCTMDQNVPLLFFFMAIFLILAFYLLSSTAEDYLEPVLTTMAEKLRFSESLAGVTLVALANGANDVFAAIAAGGSPKARILLPIGALFGAGVFVSTIVLSVCILFSKEGSIKLNPSALTRDCFFYFLGGMFILFEGLFAKNIGIGGTIGLFAIYFTFIGVVIYQEIKIRRENRARARELAAESRKKPSFQIDLHHTSSVPMPPEHMRESNISSLIKEQHIINPLEEYSNNIDSEGSDSSPSVLNNRKELIRMGGHSSIVKARFHYKMLKHKLRLELKEIRDKTLLGRVLSVLKLPFNIVRNFTIPPSTNDRWNKNILLCEPVLTSLFLIWQFGYFNILQGAVPWVIFSVVSLSVSFALWKTTQPSQVPKGLIGFILLILSFVAGVTWINYFANIFVDFISLLSVYTGMPYNYLGLTLLAWGNSLNDLFVDSALAKKGLGQIAVSGVVAGQYFNLSIGFGVSLIVQALSFGPGQFDLLEGTHIADVSLILICCLMLSMVSTLVYGYFTDYNLKKKYAIYLVTLYVTFFITATLLILVFP